MVIYFQARNQLGIPGARRIFWGPNFLNMSNTVILNYVQNIFPGGLSSPSYGPVYSSQNISKPFR